MWTGGKGRLHVLLEQDVQSSHILIAKGEVWMPSKKEKECQRQQVGISQSQLVRLFPDVAG